MYGLAHGGQRSKFMAAKVFKTAGYLGRYFKIIVKNCNKRHVVTKKRAALHQPHLSDYILTYVGALIGL